MPTLKQITEAYHAISELMKEPTSLQNAHALVTMRRELAPHAGFYADREMEIVGKYAVKKEDGSPDIRDGQFQVAAENLKAFTEEHAELDAVEVSVGGKPCLHGYTEIKPCVLEPLLDIFDFA